MICRSRKFRRSMVLLALAALSVSPRTLPAQMPHLGPSLHWGFGKAVNDYQSECEGISMAASLDIKGRGRVFPQFALDHFVGNGMGGVECVKMTPTTGGLRLDRATRLGLGIGGQLRKGPVQGEAILRAGIITGHQGYTEAGVSDDRQVLPHAGGQVALVFFRWIVLSHSTHWTRLTFDTWSDGRAASSQSTWKSMYTWQFGVRWPSQP